MDPLGNENILKFYSLRGLHPFFQNVQISFQTFSGKMGLTSPPKKPLTQDACHHQDYISIMECPPKPPFATPGSHWVRGRSK